MDRIKNSKSSVSPTISIKGNVRTDAGFLQRMYTPAGKSTTLAELNNHLEHASTRLRGSDVFSSVSTSVTLDKPAVGSDAFKANVEVEVREKGPMSLMLQSNFKQSTGLQPHSEFSSSMRNMIGVGETVKFSKTELAARAPAYSLSGNFMAEKFDISTRLKVGEDASAGGVGGASDLGPKLNVRSAETSFLSLDGGKNVVTLGMAWRDEELRTPEADTSASASKWKHAPDVCLAACTSTVAYLKWTSKVLNSLDHQIAPTKGYALNSSLELAIPPGSALFARGVITAEGHKQVGPPLFGARGLSLSSKLTLGALLPYTLHGGTGAGFRSLGKPQLTGATSTYSDRFHLGGPAAGAFAPGLRGFDTRGCGPRSSRVSGGEPLGGDVLGTLLLSATTPIPYKPLADTVRSVVFLNAGTIGGALSSLSFEDVVRNSRVAVGLGLAANMAPFRMALTYSLPMVKAPHDVIAPWQLGLSLEIA